MTPPLVPLVALSVSHSRYRGPDVRRVRLQSRREDALRGRAFFWSSLWFAGGSYLNRHPNALDAYRQLSHAAPAQTAALAYSVRPPSPSRFVEIDNERLSFR